MILKNGEKLQDFKYLSPYSEGEKSALEYLKGKRAFVVFLRYYGCTVCRVDMHNFTKSYARFAEKGVDLCVVLQSDPDVVRREAPEGTFPFEIMCDPGQDVYRQFEIMPAKSKLKMVSGDIGGLLRKAKQAKELGFEHGKYEGNEQQLPALILVDEEGIIRYSHYARNLTDMPSVDEMLGLV